MAVTKELLELAMHAAKGTAPANFSCENVNDALRGELQKMAGSINEFMRNRYDIYEIIIKTADEVLPTKLNMNLGAFAEIQQVGQGQKAMFKVRKGRMRAKKFLTQVGLSGVYETFRLDSDTFEVKTNAIGGAATIDFERYLDGAEDMGELMDILTEGLADAVYLEVQKALQAAASEMPAANYVNAAYSATDMAGLVSVARAYGAGATIFACPEFVANMGADEIVPAVTGAQGIYHPQDIDAIHNTGYINLFRGTPVVQLPNNFVDEKNDKVWVDPSYAYVLPTGADKIVKVVLEGQTQVKDHENYDNSMEIHCWKKMGTAILSYNNWCIYHDTGIAAQFAGKVEHPYGF